VWATSPSQGALSVYRIHDNRIPVPELPPLTFDPAGSTTKTKTRLIAFNAVQGCLVLEPDGKTLFRAPIEALPTQRSAKRAKMQQRPQTAGLRAMVHAQMFGDHSLLVLETERESRPESLARGRVHRRTASRLTEFEVDMRGRKTLTDLCRPLAELEQAFVEGSVFAVSRVERAVMLVVCNKEGVVEIVKFTQAS
jgi:hypothetical protein